MNTPKISVYIPSHNYGKYLGDAIESVLRQSMKDWELIIVDDNSKDNTSEVMNLYQSYPNVSLFRTKGIGLPAVCNLAISKARGEYVIRLDGDDIFDDNILLVLAHYLDNHKEAALVFPDYFLINEYGEVFAQERRERVYSNNHMLDIPPNGACTMIRMSVFSEIEKYREDLGAQDGFDLWTRVIKKHKYSNVNIPLFYYRRHGENLTGDSQRILVARRQIKKDAVTGILVDFRPIIAVIPIRKNFDFIPSLWKEQINGKSLLQRDIEVCLKSNMFDYIVVASDDPEANEVLKSYADPRLKFFLRDTQGTFRSASIVPTLEKIAAKYDPNFLGVTVLRYIQTPFVSAETLEEAITSLAFNDADSASGVEVINTQVFRRRQYGLEPINRLGSFHTDFDVIYRDAMACLATRNRNLKNGSLTGPSIVSFEVSAPECFFMSNPQHLKIAQVIASQEQSIKWKEKLELL